MKMKYIWRKQNKKDDTDIRVLKQMVTANDTMLTLGLISEDEYRKTLKDIDEKVTALEVKYGLDK